MQLLKKLQKTPKAYNFNYKNYLMKGLIDNVQENLSMTKEVNWTNLQNLYKIFMKGFTRVMKNLKPDELNF